MYVCMLLFAQVPRLDLEKSSQKLAESVLPSRLRLTHFNPKNFSKMKQELYPAAYDALTQVTIHKQGGHTYIHRHICTVYTVCMDSMYGQSTFIVYMLVCGEAHLTRHNRHNVSRITHALLSSEQGSRRERSTLIGRQIRTAGCSLWGCACYLELAIVIIFFTTFFFSMLKYGSSDMTWQELIVGALRK